MKNYIAVASIILILLFAVIGWLLIGPSMQNSAVVYKEAPISKNAKLQIVPGEVYTYLLDLNGTQATTTYFIGQGDGCTLIRMMESVNYSGSCVDDNGNDLRGYNTSLDDPSIIMFQPWMLALSDGWTWNSTTYLSVGGRLTEMAENRYRVIRQENYSGRQAFVVELRSGDQEADYAWIDSEKRVLLRMEGQGYLVTIAENATSAEGLGNASIDEGLTLNDSG